MSKYFYGASVAGIQSFIFQTGKLKEIAGASELVEQICTDLFAKHFHISPDDIHDHEGVYQAAAGAVKCLFSTKESCQAFVKDFAKAVAYHAPGIQLTQAVVEISGDAPTSEDFEKLEKKIHLSRNLPQLSVEPSSMVIQRSRRTGGASVTKKEYRDLATNAKIGAYKPSELEDGQIKGGMNRLLKKVFNREVSEEERANDFSDLVKGNENQSWIAVIHADGNGLGKLIMKLQEVLEGEAFGKFMKQFSMKLDEATEKAVQEAVTNRELGPKDLIPIIIGGDDLTVIMRAEHAVKFTEYFMKFFEEETKALIGPLKDEFPNAPDAIRDGLTACAGIAFIKYNYPVHYGLTLSEALCKEAKRVSKKDKEDLPPSSLMFYKASSSFVESFADIKKKELTPKYNKDIDFVAGPYFLDENKGKDKGCLSLDQLAKDFAAYTKEDAPKSRLREWLGEMYYDKDIAKQNLERIVQLDRSEGKSYANRLRLTEGANRLAGRIFDLELLSSVKHRNHIKETAVQA